MSPTGDGGFTVSNEKLCSGLNQILEWLHEGDVTLDDVIGYISPTEAGGKLYRDTEAFQSAFIKGASSSESSDDYSGDKASLTFVANYLDCLNLIELATEVTPTERARTPPACPDAILQGQEVDADQGDEPLPHGPLQKP